MNRRLALALLALAGCATSSPARDRTEILAVLNGQADAWNRGDLDAFVAGYRRSEETVFAGGGKVHRGFDAMVATELPTGTTELTHERSGRVRPVRVVI